ncbi:protein PF3D7_1417600 [Hydra vulgaris]|uniref:protein PF3D7_1417600 n=1 Tax=Hydra vulgaris TaxID=6087 RepID=UPI0006411DB4|nr:protein PF3D7_1417600 [Hydra vulgaris]XP_012563955.1 protein PF3D7_1417600 [Hydra vulgaris]XP_012563956.1 protein PF3D7_1417600 [Hydra vulgaris]XP_047140446.1 protein PF3D7_1417600 [Hydra vulgaris]
MEENSLSSENPQAPVSSTDNQNLESKNSAKPAGNKVEAKKCGKLLSKPAKKPLSPSKPSVSVTKNVKKPLSKTEVDTKVIPKTLSNGQTKHEEKPKSSHVVQKDVITNKATSASSAKKATSGTTVISTSKDSTVAAKVSKASNEVKQNTISSKKSATTTDGVHAATKSTPQPSSHSQESKVNNKLSSSSQPKSTKSKPAVETSKDAKPVASKQIKSTVTVVAKPPPKSTDIKATSAKPKPPPGKVADKLGSAKVSTASKPSPPVKGIKKVPPKEKASKVLKDDSNKLESKAEIINVVSDNSSVEVSEKHNDFVQVDTVKDSDKSDKVVDELKPSILNEVNNLDSPENEHVEENVHTESVQHIEGVVESFIENRIHNEIPAVIPLDETPAIVTSSLTNILTEECAAEVKESSVSHPPSEEHLDEENEEQIENRKQKFLDVTNPTSCYDEASSKPIFSTSLDEPMDSENKDLEVLQSHIISESSEINENENWIKRIKDANDHDEQGEPNLMGNTILNPELVDTANLMGNTILNPELVDTANFQNKTLEINKQELLDYLDQNDANYNDATNDANYVLSDKNCEETSEEIYLNVGENEMKSCNNKNLFDDQYGKDECCKDDICEDNVDDYEGHNDNNNNNLYDSYVDNQDCNAHIVKPESIHHVCIDPVGIDAVHESCEDSVDHNNFNNENGSDLYKNSGNVQESCKGSVDHNNFNDESGSDLYENSVIVHESFEDSVDHNNFNNNENGSDLYENSVNVHESCEDYANDSCEGSVYVQSSFEDSVQVSCEDYVHNSCEDSCVHDITHNSRKEIHNDLCKDIIDNDLCKDIIDNDLCKDNKNSCVGSTYVYDSFKDSDMAHELCEDMLNNDKSSLVLNNLVSSNDDSYENASLVEKTEFIEASVLIDKDNKVENKNDIQLTDGSDNPTLENNFKNTFDNVCIRETSLDHFHLGSDELEKRDQNLVSCCDHRYEIEQADITSFNKFHYSDTQYLDDNCNILEKNVTNEILCDTELCTKERSEIIFTKEPLEIYNNFSVVDTKLCDENQSDCANNEDFQPNITSSDESLADENSKYASVFHFNVNENQFDLSNPENCLSNEIHDKIFLETKNDVFHDYEKQSFEADENQLKKDLSDESE